MSGFEIKDTSEEDYKKRLLNQSKLNFNSLNYEFNEDERLSLHASKYKSCNLELFHLNSGMIKGSSILSKLSLGVSRKLTTPVFPINKGNKGNINEEIGDHTEYK